MEYENNVDIIWLNSDSFKDKQYLSKIFNHIKPINFVCNSNNKYIKKNDLINISGVEAIDTDSIKFIQIKINDLLS